MLCPSCGERNPDRARFCLRCGVRLDVPVRADEERKVVTSSASARFTTPMVREADGLLGDAAAALS